MIASQEQYYPRKFEVAYVPDSPSYRGKELQLGFNTAVVISFGPFYHSKSDCHDVSHAELWNKIFQKLEEVFTNGQWALCCFHWLLQLRPACILGEPSL